MEWPCDISPQTSCRPISSGGGGNFLNSLSITAGRTAYGASHARRPCSSRRRPIAVSGSLAGHRRLTVVARRIIAITGTSYGVETKTAHSPGLRSAGGAGSRQSLAASPLEDSPTRFRERANGRPSHLRPPLLSSDAAADPHRLSQASSAADGRRSDISARPGPDHKHASPSSPDEPLTTLAPHALSAPAVSSVRKVTRAGEDCQRSKRDRDGRTSMHASANLPTASTVDCHLASRNRWRWRASSVSACSTRRQAAGDATTRTTHSDRSCSLATASGCTNSIASTPLAAARRSSYAARRQPWEHHFGGRPRPGFFRGAPHRGHLSPSTGLTSRRFSDMYQEAHIDRTNRTDAAYSPSEPNAERFIRGC